MGGSQGGWDWISVARTSLFIGTWESHQERWDWIQAGMLVCLFSKALSIYCCLLSAEDVMVSEAGRIRSRGAGIQLGGEVEEPTIKEAMS